MTLIHHTLVVARLEAQYFFRHRKLALAALIVALVPALYSLIYLSSVWDPEANSGALPVGIVNHDEGLQYGEHVFNIGRDVVTALKKEGRFGFRDHADEQEVRRLVRNGTLAFALILPKDFSANAIPGSTAGAGKPIIFVAEGNNIESASIARRFAQRLDQQINENLAEQRWSVVFANALGSQRSVDVLRASVADLNRGAKLLGDGAAKTALGSMSVASGSHQLADSTKKFVEGAGQLSAGIMAIDAQRPTNQDLNRLRNGADALVRGHDSMTVGLAELRAGSQQLHAGAETLHEATSKSVLAPEELVDGARQLLDGATKLDAGTQTAVESHTKLADGARQLRNGTTRLVTGVRSMGEGVHEMALKLPPSAQLEAFTEGAETLQDGAQRAAKATKEVAKGAQQLSLGLAQLNQALPAKVATPDGSPEGLAHSVVPVLELEAPVENSGSGFSPNVISAALWLGAGVAVFLLHVRVLPVQAKPMGRVARLLGKISLPTMVVILQVLVVCALVKWVLHIQLLHPGPFILTLGLSALTFLLIVFALARAFGDAGKGLAMILLAVQLSSSGGILPVELSGRLFVDVSPWLPLTWVIKALKASMFDAYAGDWQGPLGMVALWTFGAALFAIHVGRWRFVDQNALRPPVDI